MVLIFIYCKDGGPCLSAVDYVFQQVWNEVMADHELRVLPFLAAIPLYVQSCQDSQEEGFMSGLAAKFGTCTTTMKAHECGSVGQKQHFLRIQEIFVELQGKRRGFRHHEV